MELTEQDKQFTILRIKTTAANTKISITKGKVYSWGEGNDVTNPGEANSSHVYAKAGEYIIKIGIVQMKVILSTFPLMTANYFGIELGSDVTTRNSVIEVINIGETTSSIQKTFKDCKKLVKTCETLPKRVYMTVGAFINCESLETSLTTLENLTNLTDLESMYDGCRKLKQMPKFPPNLKYMNYTFRNCNSLEEGFDMPDSVRSALEAFSGCSSLKKMGKLSSSCTNYKNCFANTSALTECPDFPKTLPNNCNISSMYANSGIQVLKHIPDTITSIEEICNGSHVKTIINIPASVTNAHRAFMKCPVKHLDLNYADFPNLTNAEEMFREATHLEEVIQGTPNASLKCANMYNNCTNLKVATSSYNNLTASTAKTNGANMYLGCNNIEVLDEGPGTIYDIPVPFGGKEGYLGLRITTTNENKIFGFSSAKAISWGDNSTPSTDTANVRHTYNKPGTYVVDLEPINNAIKLANPSDLSEETNAYLKPLVEVINVPKNLQLKDLFSVCVNLTKVCSLKKNVSTDYSSLFSTCKSLKELPEINYDNIDNATNMFSGIPIEDIDVYFKNATKIDNLFEKCPNLKKAKVKAGSKCTSATGIFSICSSLQKAKLDFSECSLLKSLDSLFSDCILMTEDDIKMLLPKSLSISAKHFVLNCNLRNTYKMNFSPSNLIGAFTNSNSIAMLSTKESANQAVLSGQTSESDANQSLQTQFGTYNDCYKRIKKVHNYWEKFATMLNSNHCFALCNELDIFIDLDTGKETFGSLGLIPVIWGGAYDSTKNVIAIEITQPNTEFKINNVDNNWIDYGKMTKCISKDETCIYEKPGRYFITCYGDFDIPKECRKHVTQVCNLIDTCTFGKDGFMDYENLIYCCRITKNETGDYSNYFVNCKHLMNTPEIPSNAVILDRAFSGTKITKPPIIPNTVKSTVSCFDECRNLKEDVVIPTTVENFSFTFRNCVNIESFVGNWNNTYSEKTKKVAVYKGNPNGTIPTDWI